MTVLSFCPTTVIPAPPLSAICYFAGCRRHLSVLTLYVNGLNATIKRHRIANWVKKQNSTIGFSQKNHINEKNKHWFRVKE
jgi:hypothetical protein